MVAAGHELTAAAAAEILQDGGNAFDACVAGLFMTFVAEAVFASPGGGGFLMARRAGSDKITLFDFFAETPRKRRPASEIDFYPIYADFGPAKQEFHIGAGSSATPGMVPGLFAMHQELCRLPMKRLVEPAVRAARAGFPLDRIPGLSPHRHRADPQGDDGRGEDFCARGHAAESRRDLQQPRSCRDHRMARRGWRASLGGRRCRPGHRQAAARRRRLPHLMPILPTIAWRGGRPSCGRTTVRSSRSTRRPRQAGR